MDDLRTRTSATLIAAALALGSTSCGEDDTGEQASASRSESPTATSEPTAFVKGKLTNCFIPNNASAVDPITLRAKGLTLPGAAFSPPDDAAPKAVMVLLHQTDGDGLCGWGEFGALAAMEGVAGVAFDQCGYGDARCDVADPDDPLPQVRAAVRWARDRWPDTRVVLVGASMGGSQTVRAVAAGIDVDGWVDLSGPSEWVGVKLIGLADRIDLPGMVVISEEADGAEETAAAEKLAAATSAEFVAADTGHGYETITDPAGQLLPVGERVIAFAVGGHH
ncbi:hypothetical protein ASG90_13970 [Nocardioides sp. Soil797]|nr:hypothetical protein ASG90_13970 [Nocardioides sp. Soil797]